MAKLLSACPVCNGDLVISTLKCTNCGLEMKNDFELNPFSLLPDEQMDFLCLFLKKQGNLKAVQEELVISYPTAKKRLSDLLCTLRLEEGPETMQKELCMDDWKIDFESTKASDIVRAKLVACGGRTVVHTLQGKTYSVWVESQTTFACDKITSYSYDIFDVIVDHIVAEGGRAKKGSGRGHLGDHNCGDETIAAAILQNYWHSDTGLDPGFVMYAILEWAGIAHNQRSYVELTAEYRSMRSK